MKNRRQGNERRSSYVRNIAILVLVVVMFGAVLVIGTQAALQYQVTSLVTRMDRLETMLHSLRYQRDSR